MMNYRPTDHYWIVGGSTTEVYSSRRNTMVPTDDPDYVAWQRPMQMGPDAPQKLPGEAEDVEALREIIAPLFLLPEWLIVAQPTFIQPAVDEFTPEQLKEYSADRRWREEITGIEVNSMPVATDRKSQGLTATARDYAKDTPQNATVSYKIADGTFVELSSSEMIQVATAVFGHVQGCFTVEADVAGQIEGGGVTTLEQIDAAYEPMAKRPGRVQFERLRRWAKVI